MDHRSDSSSSASSPAPSESDTSTTTSNTTPPSPSNSQLSTSQNPLIATSHLDGVNYLFGHPISHSLSPLLHQTVYLPYSSSLLAHTPKWSRIVALCLFYHAKIQKTLHSAILFFSSRAFLKSRNTRESKMYFRL